MALIKVQMKLLLYFLSILVSAQSFSINAFAINEAQIPARFMQELVPYMLNQYQRGQFIGQEGIKINYYFLENPGAEGVLIISPGQSESSLKYAEFLYDLKDLNYSIYIIDHRGQGYSGRMLPDAIKSHVSKFSDYVDDFSYFVNDIVRPKGYEKSFIIAHSMGGAIASGYLAHYSKEVTGVILLAPMLQIDTGFFNNSSSYTIAQLLRLAGQSENYAPTQQPYNSKAAFKDNEVTSSRHRYKMRQSLYNDERYTDLRVGGTTVKWLKEALEYTQNLRTTKNLYQIPTLLFQAGKDQKVLSRGQNDACERLSPKMCKVVRNGYEESQHEILMEVDVIRNQALQQIKDFIHSPTVN